MSSIRSHTLAGPAFLCPKDEPLLVIISVRIGLMGPSTQFPSNRLPGFIEEALVVLLPCFFLDILIKK